MGGLKAVFKSYFVYFQNYAQINTNITLFNFQFSKFILFFNLKHFSDQIAIKFFKKDCFNIFFNMTKKSNFC